MAILENKENLKNIAPDGQEKLKAQEFAKENTAFLDEFFRSSLPAAEKRTIESKTKDDI